MRRSVILITITALLYICIVPAQAQENQKVVDIKFIAVSAYLVTMTVFDVETTFGAIRNGAHEANPIMKPFIDSGRPATYALQLGIDALLIFVAYEMKKSSNSDFNKRWWVLPMVSATEHAVCGGLNLRYAW